MVSQDRRRQTVGTLSVLISSLLVFHVASSEGATRTWTNTVGGSWETAGNWDPAGSPTNTDNLNFTYNASYTVNVDNATANLGDPSTWLTVNTLNLQATGPLLLIDFTNTARTLTITGTASDALQVRAGGNLALLNGSLLLNGGYELGLSSLGTMLMSGGTFTVTNAVNKVGAFGSLAVSGGNYRGYLLDVDGSYTLSGGTNVVDLKLRTGIGASATGTVTMTGGMLIVTNSDFILGNSGKGVVNLSGGTLLGKNVSFGDNPGGRGEWNITGGQAKVLENLSMAAQNSSTGILQIANNGLLEFGNWTLTVGGTGTGRGFLTNRNGGTLRFTGVNNPAIVVNAGSTAILQSATIEFKDTAAANLSGNITKITQIGDNTLSLNHASNAPVASYTFQTNNGQNFAFLKLSNDGAFQAATVTAGPGGAISGEGTLTGTTTVQGGATVSPGNSVGVLNFGNGLTLESNAVLRLDIGPTLYDQIAVIGSVNISNSLLQITPTASVTNGSFLIVDNDGTSDATLGQFLGLTNNAFLDASANGFDAYFRIQYNAGDGNDVLLLATVPEPSALTMLALAGVALMWRRR